MIGTKQKSLGDEIIELLLQKNYSAEELFEDLSNKNIKTTKQSLYKHLKNLISKEIVLKDKKTYSISQEWKNVLREMLSIITIPLPDVGEKMSHTFSSLGHLDQYWKHIVESLFQKHPRDPVFLYSSHQFWPYVADRMSSEVRLIQNTSKQRSRRSYFILGGNTPLDKKYKKIFHNEFYKVALVPEFQKERHVHTIVIGDTLVYTYIDKNIAQKIDDTYTSNDDLDIQVKYLKEILNTEHKCKIKIENNAKKSSCVQTAFLKNFYNIKSPTWDFFYS